MLVLVRVYQVLSVYSLPVLTRILLEILALLEELTILAIARCFDTIIISIISYI